MVSVFVAKSIRGCHPTFSSTPCNDDWFLISLLDYYRIHCSHNHPHPAKYWRYAFEGKWGWNHSVTDFKTQSVKEYIMLKKVVDSKHNEIFYILLCIHRICSNYPNTNDVMFLIKQYLFYEYICDYQQMLLNHIEHSCTPIGLPKLHPINPLQVFIGRCKQYGILHKKTNSFIVTIEISFDTLIEHCKVIPRPHVKHPYLYIHNRETFYFFIRCVHKVDVSHYDDPLHTPFLSACHSNITGVKNEIFYKYIEPSHPLKQKSMIDSWCEDLFGW